MKRVQGILLLYDHRIFPFKDAATITEHVNSFRLHSQFKVWQLNTRLGFPASLNNMQFPTILLHYSLFGGRRYMLDNRFLKYLEKCSSSYKIAFFQDEYYFCKQRFDFLNRFKIDCVYTLLHPEYFKDVYHKYTKVPKIIPTLTGYVSDVLVKKAVKFAKPDEARTIDVGYRGRKLPYYMGKGAQEKYEIAFGFKQRALGTDLVIDIETGEGKRLYGAAWYRFLGNCRACLGTEAGVSIFDTEDFVQTECERLMIEQPNITFDEMSKLLLRRYEGNIPYRTISPRIFEAAAFHICQILYEGDYQGILKPMVHYIPLKKDFSNFGDVLRLLKDKAFCKTLTDNCFRDLIQSEKYSYRSFVRSFDQELLSTGFVPVSSPGKSLFISSSLFWDAQIRIFSAYWFLFMRLAAYGNIFIRHVLAIALGIYWNRVSPHVWRIRKRLFNLPDKMSGAK